MKHTLKTHLSGHTVWPDILTERVVGCVPVNILIEVNQELCVIVRGPQVRAVLPNHNKDILVNPIELKSGTFYDKQRTQSLVDIFVKSV